MPYNIQKLTKDSCITLIGMPGVGKSTVGLELAKELAFYHVDTDYIIESIYGVPLQKIADKLTKEEFLDLEGEVIEKLNLKKIVISTGGSVVYRESAMQALKKSGLCIFLSAPLDLILERIAENPDRGLAIAPNQTIEDLYNERQELYTKYADLTIHTDKNSTLDGVIKEITSTVSLHNRS